MSTYTTTTLRSGEAAIRIDSALETYRAAQAAWEANKTVENMAYVVAKIAPLAAELVMPLALCAPVFGNIASAIDLVNELSAATRELNGYTDSNGVPHAPGVLTGTRLRDILSAALGVVPFIGNYAKLLSKISDAYQILSSVSNLTGDGNAVASTLDSFIVFSLGNPVGVATAYAEYLDDPTKYQSYKTFDERAILEQVVGKIDFANLISSAANGDAAAQWTLENGATSSQSLPQGYAAAQRPIVYWQERAQLLLLKTREDIFQSDVGAPATYGPDGRYEGYIGGTYISGSVGIVDYLQGTTYQFGKQGDWAGSALGNDKYWGTSAADSYDALSGDDVIYGFEGDDVLKGNLGQDTIYAGADNDKVWGGAGDDLIYGESENDQLYGEADSDTLYGGTGNDYLDGGTGLDHMYGGADNDTYIVDEAGDDIHESVNEGTDLVIASVSYTLAANVENGTIALTASNGATLTGNGLDNILTNASDIGQTLHGGAGADKLYGGLQTDTLDGGDDLDTDYLAGGAGNDVYDAFGNDVIYDSDLRGHVNLGGHLLTGGEHYGTAPDGSQLYKSRDGEVLYSYNASNNKLTVSSPQGVVTILNYYRINPALRSIPGNEALGLGIDLTGGPTTPDPLQQLLNAAFTTAQVTRLPLKIDPLVLDLNGDGVLSTTAEGTSTHFDSNANGFAESTGWVGSADGLVVRDLNGNGTIDSGRELFGDQTLLPNGSFANNGFQAIAALDTNADGKVNSLDAAWSELRVWRDADGDGSTDAGELLTMASAGVSSINTGYSTVNLTDSNGNTLAQSGNFTRTDGSAGKAGSFLFNRDPMNSTPASSVAESVAVQALPDISTFGNVYSLRQAMARDPALLASVTALVASSDYKNLRAGFETLVQQWVGASGISATARGANIDARQLAVLEAFYGQGFLGINGSDPNVTAAPVLKDAYAKLLDGFYAQYLAQAQLKSVWQTVAINWNETGGALAADFSGTQAVLQSLLGPTPTMALQLLYEFGKGVKQFGLDGSPSFQALEASLDALMVGYGKAVQAGVDGVPFVLSVGTSGTDALSLSGRGFAYGLDGNDNVVGSAGADVISGGAGNDMLSGLDGNDLLEGGDGDDVLDGGVGADVLRGGSGNDTLGGAPNSADAGSNYGYPSYYYYSPIAGNTYEGGAGNDLLRGTSMADLYLFNLGDGQDVIREVEVTNQPTGQVDVIRFGAGIAASDISVSRNGTSLVLSHINGSDKVTVESWYSTVGSTTNQVERVEFADGTAWTNTQLTALGLIVQGTAGNDTLNGVSNFGDTLRGGAGNDVLNGLDGNDVLEGGEGDDVLDGGVGADVLRGGAGNDTLGGAPSSADAGSNYGYPSYYYYSPIAGNIYEGGTGNDLLRGTSLADLYLFNLGDGQDVIREVEVTNQPAGQADVLRFGAGIVASDFSVSRNGTSMVLSHVNGSDKVTVENWYSTVGSTTNQVERFEFADGTAWTAAQLTTWGLTVKGTAGNDTLNGVSNFGDTLLGGAGNDTLNGLDGNDVLEGGDGDDVLDGGYGADVLRGGAGNDTLGGVAGSSDSGFVASYGYVSPTAGNTYEGGTGNDTLRGTSMADLYLFSLGDGADTIYELELNGQPTAQVDVLRFSAGIASTDITVTRVGVNLVLSHANGTDKVTIANWYTSAGSVANQVERVEFEDGTTWLRADLTARGLVVDGTAGNDTLAGVSNYGDTLRGGAGNDILNGVDGNDVLEGGDGNDVLDGGYGADVLRGGSGDDTLGGALNSADSGYVASYGYVGPGGGNTYEGGTGNDILRGTSMADLYLFNLGDGADTIYELELGGQPAAQVDVLRFSAGISPSEISVTRSGVNLVLSHVNGTDRVTVANWYTTVGSISNQVERVEFTDGTVWLSADLTARGLIIDGTGGNDVLSGTSYGDTLRGGAGNDTLSGLDGNDVLEGGDGDDVLDGGAGADMLRGGAGNDTLGGAPNSADAGFNYGYPSYFYLSPLAGNTYDGGTGNDVLRGTSMADLYLFNLGDGQDTIREVEVYLQPSGQADVLRFGTGIAASDISVSRNGTSMVLRHVNGSDRVTIENWYSTAGSTANQVERVEFADSTVWTNTQMTAWGLIVQGTVGDDTLNGVSSYGDTLLGGAGNDTLNGLDGNDVLEGGDGDDVLDGGVGADVLHGGAGSDTLGGAPNSVDAGFNSGYPYYSYSSPVAGNTYEGGTGNDLLRGTSMADLYLFNLGDGQDTIREVEVYLQPAAQADVLRFGAGIAPSDISVSRNGTSMVLSHLNGSDRVTIENWYSTEGSTTNQVERVEFADGTVWSASTLTAQGLIATGTAGADSLTGLAGYADILMGGQGNDQLAGLAGNDTYRYFAGDGYDTVTDTGGTADIVDFANISFSSAAFYRVGADLEVSLGSGQGVLVKNQFGTGGAIEFMLFAGASYSAAQIAGIAGPRP